MSVTYSTLITAIESAFATESIGSSLAPSPVQSKSTKASAGSGNKYVASIRELAITPNQRGVEHGNNLTLGRLTFSLRPSTASAELNLASIADTAETAHRAVLALDGLSGIRAEVQRVTCSPAEVRFEVSLVFGSIVISKTTDDLLLGRV